MGPFLGGLGPKNETLPGTIRSTFGSRFQPPFGCHRGQTSGSAVVQHVTIPNLLT